MKKKYDLMWLFVMIAYIVTTVIAGYITVSTVLCMAQHGGQSWNFWEIVLNISRRLHG